MARFVGADRGLKRLALRRVEDLELRPAATIRVGEPAEKARALAVDPDFAYVLVVDDDAGPVGWLRADELPTTGAISAEAARPDSPILMRRTTLKDALSQMLGADVMAGIVVDDRRRVLGLVMVDQIAAALRIGS